MGKAAIFDTLAYANRLKNVGIPEKQAEAHAELLAEFATTKIVTQHYLAVKLAELKTELVRWVLGIVLGVSAVQASIIFSCIKMVH